MTDNRLAETVNATMVCPTTGLPIKSRPEWTDRRFGSGYRLTTRVVGNHILLNQPSGYAELDDIVESLRMTDAVVRDHIDQSHGYVHISDYSGMRGITREARKHYIRHMAGRKHMLGLIYFGASPLFSTMIKLAKRLNMVPFNVLIVRDYHAALMTASRLVASGRPNTMHPASESGLDDSEITAHEEGGHQVLRCDRWKFVADGYDLTVEVIDRRIYHARSSGTLKEAHVAPVADLREQVRETLGLHDGFAAIVTGTTDTHGSDRRARRQYMASLKRWHEQYPMALYVFYNANRFIRTAAMLAAPLMPFKVKIAPDLTGAIALVDRLVQTPRSIPGEAHSPVDPASEDQFPIVHQLLQFIGDIDWERHGTPTPEQIHQDHPFRPVFDAIALIKGELDELLEEQRRVENELRERQQRFDEVLLHSRDILFKRHVGSGTYDYVSDAVRHLLDISPDAIQQMGFSGVSSLVHPQDLARFLAFNKTMLEADDETDSHVIEYRMRDSQGRYRWFSDSHAVVRDATGKPAFIIGSNRDITDQKTAEAELKAAYQRFTTVLDSISAHIYVADMENFEILFMNKSMRDDFGEGHLGDRCYAVFRGAADVCPQCSNEKLVDKNGRPTGIHTWEGLNPVLDRWFLNHDRAIRWVDGRLVRLQIAMDITRIKTLEAERQEVAERLRHTRKLEAVNTLAGGVAHNFNNLLMVIMGNLELMRMETRAGSRVSRKIDAAENAAQRAADLSTLMLTYVGQTQISPQRVDLNVVGEEMVGVLKATVAEKARLTLVPAENPAWIHADTPKVCQVITNLVTNAVEATGDHPIEIRLSVGSQHCDAVQLSRLAPGENLPKGNYVWLRVADNGRGMDKETLEKVFDPFFTTKFTGRGLGMAAVMGILRAHRGGVRIDSRPDAGTTVTIYFPERKVSATQPLAASSTQAAMDRRGTVLLVDDEPLVLELGEQMLGMLGFDVLTASDGQEALRVFDTYRDGIRMAVVDINMPRMGGRETVVHLHAKDASLPILISSGYTESQAREKLGDVSVTGFIKKPFRMDQLHEKVDAIFVSAAE